MAAAEAHATGAGLLALPEVFETDADRAVRANRDGRSLFLGGGTDVAVHGDPPLARTIADSPYARYRRRSIPLPRRSLPCPAHAKTPTAACAAVGVWSYSSISFRRINPSDPGDRIA